MVCRSLHKLSHLIQRRKDNLPLQVAVKGVSQSSWFLFVESNIGCISWSLMLSFLSPIFHVYRWSLRIYINDEFLKFSNFLLSLMLKVWNLACCKFCIFAHSYPFQTTRPNRVSSKPTPAVTESSNGREWFPFYHPRLSSGLTFSDRFPTVVHPYLPQLQLQFWISTVSLFLLLLVLSFNFRFPHS